MWGSVKLEVYGVMSRSTLLRLILMAAGSLAGVCVCAREHACVYISSIQNHACQGQAYYMAREGGRTYCQIVGTPAQLQASLQLLNLAPELCVLALQTPKKIPRMSG